MLTVAGRGTVDGGSHPGWDLSQLSVGDRIGKDSFLRVSWRLLLKLLLLGQLLKLLMLMCRFRGSSVAIVVVVVALHDDGAAVVLEHALGFAVATSVVVIGANSPHLAKRVKPGLRFR